MERYAIQATHLTNTYLTNTSIKGVLYPKLNTAEAQMASTSFLRNHVTIQQTFVSRNTPQIPMKHFDWTYQFSVTQNNSI